MAEIRIEEKKNKGAPWLLILLLLAVAAVGFWLWSSRGNRADDTTGTPAGAMTDTTAGGAPRTP